MASDSDNFKPRQARGWGKPYHLMRERSSPKELCRSVEGAFKRTISGKVRRELKQVAERIETVLQGYSGVLPGMNDGDQIQNELDHQLDFIRAAYADCDLTPVICEAALSAASQWAEDGHHANTGAQEFFIDELDERVKRHQCFDPMKHTICEQTGMLSQEYESIAGKVCSESAQATKEMLRKAISGKKHADLTPPIDHTPAGLDALILA
ncbi:MAG TPA: hypothetical protein VHC95_05375 [Opitutales bacterium]|nr:hypothetical protein [Opitutales bacterium]